MKKVLSVVLSTLMMISILPFKAFADSGNKDLKKNATKVENDEWEIKLSVDGRNIDYAKPGDKKPNDVDLVILYDQSNSMFSWGKMNTLKYITKKFIDDLATNDYVEDVGLVTFGTKSYIKSDLKDVESNKDQLKKTIDGIQKESSSTPSWDWSGLALGGTNMQQGLIKAQEMLSKSTANHKMVVVFSDGKVTFAGGPSLWNLVGSGKYTTPLVSYMTKSAANNLKSMSVEGEKVKIVPVSFFNGGSSHIDFLKDIGSDNMCYNVNSTNFYIQDILGDVYGDDIIVSKAKYQNAKVIDPMGKDFELLKNTVKVSQGKTTIASDGTITWEIGSLGKDQKATLTYRVKLKEIVAGGQKNIATNGKTTIEYENEEEGEKEDEFEVPVVSYKTGDLVVKYNGVPNAPQDQEFDHKVVKNNKFTFKGPKDFESHILSSVTVDGEKVDMNNAFEKVGSKYAIDVKEGKTEIVYNYDAIKYNVEFIVDGKVIDTQEVEHGKDAIEPAKDTYEEEGKNYSKWDKDFTNVTSDLKVNKTSSIKKYTVTFVDYDDTELGKDTVKHGEAAKAPKDPTREGYDFKGWDKEFTNVTSDMTVKAQYETSSYTVTFVDYDDKELGKDTVKHGEAAKAPKNPTREGYDFKCWDKEFTNVTSDLVVKAQYETSSYTVTFVDYNDKELGKDTVKHGEAAKAPENPTREGYDFKGWDKEFTNVTSDLTVKAQYETSSYTVTFVDYDDTELGKDTVKHGEAAKAPKDPTREGYDFKGWDKEFTNVTSDMTVKAQYETSSYTVTFVDYDDKELGKDTVKHGEAAKAPKDPTREGYDFTGWDKEFTNVTSDLTVKAQYETSSYTVTFVDYDDTELGKDTVKHGEAAKAPKDPTREGYDFTGWDKEFTNVTSDMTVKAQYETSSYTVTFVDYDDKELGKDTVKHGEAAKAPKDPTREGYDFTGWDKEFTNVTSDLTVKAQYETSSYTVTFVDYDDKELGKDTVKHGEAAKAPKDPTREGYDFTGWDKEFTNVTSDLTVKAQYKTSSYTVKFIANGNEIKNETVKYGKDVTVPDFPNTPGITYTGWDIDNDNYSIKDGKIENIKHNLVVIAENEQNKYTVVYQYMDTDDNDKIIDGKIIKDLLYGDKTPTAPKGLPDGYTVGYEFDNKNAPFGEIADKVTKNKVYTAKIKKIEYNVTFVDDDKDQTVLGTDKVKHGGKATPPTVENKVVDGKKFEFSKWDKEFSNVTSDMIVTAQYKEIVKIIEPTPLTPPTNYYKVTFVDYDGKTVLGTDTVKKGEAAKAPKDPTREGYDFTGWDKDFSKVTDNMTVQAQYKIKEYTVIFEDDDGTKLGEDTVEHGGTAVAPGTPSKDGHEFSGWDKDITNVTDNMTVQATYNEAGTVDIIDDEIATTNPGTDDNVIFLVSILGIMIVLFAVSKKVIKIAK